MFSYTRMYTLNSECQMPKFYTNSYIVPCATVQISIAHPFLFPFFGNGIVVLSRAVRKAEVAEVGACTNGRRERMLASRFD